MRKTVKSPNFLSHKLSSVHVCSPTCVCALQNKLRPGNMPADEKRFALLLRFVPTFLAVLHLHTLGPLTQKKRVRAMLTMIISSRTAVAFTNDNVDPWHSHEWCGAVASSVTLDPSVPFTERHHPIRDERHHLHEAAVKIP